MSLYKIMIVDDEAEVREAIVKKLDWERLGFAVAADAENGLDALEKAESLELDVVITDLKMPFMGGLELGAKLRERYPGIKLVIFSGFDEFEYAQEAIKLNVIEYVLKPVNAAELSAVLERIKHILDEEIEQKRNFELLKTHYDKSIPVIRLRYLTDLLRGKVPDSDEEITAYLQDLGVSLADGGEWRLAAVAKIESEEYHGAREWEMLCISVSQIMEERLEGLGAYATLIYRTQPVVILTLTDPDQVRMVMNAMDDACRTCRRVLNITLTVGIGRPYSVFRKLPASYNEGTAALDYRRVMGSERAIYAGDVSDTVPVPECFPEESGKQLVNIVTFGTPEEMAAAAEALARKAIAGESHFAHYQMYAIGIVNTLLQIIGKFGLSADEVFGDTGDYLQILSVFYEEAQFSDWLFSVCAKIREGINKKRLTTTQNLVMMAKQIIEEQYANPEFSLEVLCQKLHISPSYLSTLFKQETGVSYVNYLTEVRMRHAVELLKTTNDKTYMIAEKVGYLEANYFSYVFKKRFGMSPSHYRSQAAALSR